MIIIGITGTIGAGKGTIVDYLKNEKGFLHFSVREYLKEEIIRRGMVVDRDTLTNVANELRQKHSPSYIVDELYRRALYTGINSVIESIRTPGEVDSLRQKGHFYLLAVDAEPELRYERIKKRASETDHVTFDTFLSNELREMNSNDPNRQNLKKTISMADYVFSNEGSVEQLRAKVEVFLMQLTDYETKQS